MFILKVIGIVVLIGIIDRFFESAEKVMNQRKVCVEDYGSSNKVIK